MKLVLYLVLLAFVSLVMISISKMFLTERKVSSRNEMTNSEIALIENVVTRAKYAVDLAGNGNPILNNCPTGSTLRTMKGQPSVQICWPSNDKICESTIKLLACIDSSQSVAKNSFNNFLKISLHLFGSALAGAAIAPATFGAAGSGFFISGANPVACTPSTCLSFVISICNNNSGVCGGPKKYVTQTISFNN